MYSIGTKSSRGTDLNASITCLVLSAPQPISSCISSSLFMNLTRKKIIRGQIIRGNLSRTCISYDLIPAKYRVYILQGASDVLHVRAYVCNGLTYFFRCFYVTAALLCAAANKH